MNLDLGKLGVPVACVAKAGDKHKPEDRVYASALRVNSDLKSLYG
jgi:hypothetical protein